MHARLPGYVIAVAITSLGGLLNGFDTGIIGPITNMAQFEHDFGHLSPSMHGTVVSSILLSTALTSVFAGLLSDRFGRTRVLFVGSCGFAVGASVEAASKTIGMLLAGRLVVGAGQGLFLSVLTVYICEIAPPKNRGALGSSVQFLITVGLCIGYFTCYGTQRISGPFSWRLPFIIKASMAGIAALLTALYLPESPRWLYDRGAVESAGKVLDKLDVSGAEREKMTEARQAKDGRPVPTTATKSLWQYLPFQAVAKKGARKQLALGVFLMGFQQLSGIDAVLYYAPVLFQQAGLSSAKASFLASGVSAILIFVTTVPAFLLSDKIGRMPSTIGGGLALMACMVLIGSLYASGSVSATSGAERWVVIVTIYLYSVAYCTTWALGIKVFATEIQPLETRASATSLAQMINCISNFFVAFITPVLIAQSSFGAYYLFAGCIAVTTVVCYIYMPETRGVSLETVEATVRVQRQGIFARQEAVTSQFSLALANNNSESRRLGQEVSDPNSTLQSDSSIRNVLSNPEAIVSQPSIVGRPVMVC